MTLHHQSYCTELEPTVGTSDDVRTLKLHEIAADAVAYPGHALLVDTRSTHINMLNKLAPQSAQLAMKAIDSVACQTGHISLSLSPLCRTKDLKRAVFTIHSN